MPAKIKITATHCNFVNFSLYANLAYNDATSGLENANAATMLTLYVPIPIFRNRLANAERIPKTAKYFSASLVGMEKETFEMPICTALIANIENSKINEVNIGPRADIGILIRK